jgi:hypothetical protein
MLMIVIGVRQSAAFTFRRENIPRSRPEPHQGNFMHHKRLTIRDSHARRRIRQICELAATLEIHAICDTFSEMSGNVREIEQAIRTLPRTDIEQLRNWIENFLEDQLELSEEFQARIENGKRDLAEGRVRTRQPDEA